MILFAKTIYLTPIDGKVFVSALKLEMIIFFSKFIQPNIKIMNVLTKVQNWGNHHHPKWIDYFRILLGLVLIWKGIAFASNLQAFTNMMKDAMLGVAVSISLMAHIIIVLHIIGGILIAIGSQTRLFCALNLPILIVAVFFVNLRADIFRPYAEFWVSCVVLIGLVCFLIEGNGVLSIEHEKKAVV